MDQDFWVRTNLGSSALERASTAAADAAADPSVGFDLEFLRTVAREVGRWAHALGVTLLESQAAEIAGP